MSTNDRQSKTAAMPSREELAVVAECLEGEARRPWHIHPNDSEAASKAAAWLRRLIAEGHHD